MSTKYETGQKGEAVLMCDNDNCNVQAEARCFDCEIFMCASCIKAHNLMSKFTKDHRLMTLEEIKEKGVPPMEKPTLCDKHKGKKQKLFCEQCETLICKDCTLIDHKDHKFAFIADVVEKHKENLRKEMNYASCTTKPIESVLKAVKAMQERVRENEENVKKEIDDQIDAQIEVLEQTRTSLKQQSTALTAIKMKRLSSQQHGLEMHLAGLSSALEFTENLLTKGSCSDVLSMVKQIKLRLSELSKKDIDDEVNEEDTQILEVNLNAEISHGGRIAIKDASVPDPKNCTLDWIPDTDSILLQVRNYLNEPVDIKMDRIQINCTLQCNCHKTGKGRFKITGVIGNPCRLNQKDRRKITDHQKNLEVMVDGLSVPGSLKVVSMQLMLKHLNQVGGYY